MVFRQLRGTVQTPRPLMIPLPKTKKYCELCNPFDHFHDDEIVAPYQFHEATIRCHKRLLGPDLKQPTRRGHALPVCIQSSVTFIYYVTGTFRNAIGDILHVSKMSVSQIVTAVSWALALKMDQCITFLSCE